MAGPQTGGVQVLPVLLGGHGPVDWVLVLKLVEQVEQIEVRVVWAVQESSELGPLKQQLDVGGANLAMWKTAYMVMVMGNDNVGAD